MTMKLVYIGAHDAVEVPLPSGATLRAERDGESISVPAALGERLLEQADNWRPTNPEGRAAKRDLEEQARADLAAEADAAKEAAAQAEAERAAAEKAAAKAATTDTKEG